MEMKIMQPITVGGITLKNRIMFPPLTTGYEERDGSIGEQSRAFYTRLAQGGVGYIVLGDVAPIRSFSPTPKLFDDSQIESFRLLADSVHAYGAKLGVQIFHPEYDCDAVNALFAQGKMEEVRARLHHDMQFFTDEVSEETLLSIIDKICACAQRAQKAGVDVVQVHGDRLVGCLCSTRMNHRTDKFGGSLENRTRFAIMLVRALKRAVPEMVIDYKFAVVTPERGKGGRRSEICPLAGGSRRGYASCGAGQSYRQYGGYHPAYGRTALRLFCGHCRAGEGVCVYSGQHGRAHYRPRYGRADRRKRKGGYHRFGPPAPVRPGLAEQSAVGLCVRYPTLHFVQQGMYG